MIAVYIYLLSRTAVYASNYDYIVVGSGSAGSVVTRRLSDDPSIRVLLLEAGGGDPDLIAEIPLFSENLRVSPISWNYTTVPLKYAGSGLKDKISLVPRGKVLGGTSTINANLYTRGNKNDYNDWAAQGADGWDWENVFPYFFRLEDNGDRFVVSRPDQPINRPPFHSPIAEAYAKAAESLGYPSGDYNGETQQVFMIPKGTIKNGRRCSGLHCILNPIRGRENLTISTFAHVTKILIDENKRAYGVAYDRNNESFEAIANKEVILCAGVFNSAQLLMLSGIGPKKELEKLNIPVIADLPVGENLQDHPTTFGLLFEADTYTYKENNITTGDFLQFVSYGLGPLTSFAAVETIGFIKSKLAKLDVPDLEILWRTAIVAQNKISFMGAVNGNDEMWEVLQPYSQLNVIQCFPYVLIPKSIGRMWLASANPYDSPLIDPNYYADENDTKVIVEGMKFCLEMAAQEPMKEYGVKPIPVKFPGCESYKPFDDDYLACVAKTALVSFDHFVGTCKMGNPNDSTTVVDPSLRVKGISSLRVVDASIMPTIVSGHTHAAAAMIGGKGAALILSDQQNLLEDN